MRNEMGALNNSPDWIDLNLAERLYSYSRRQFWYWITEGRLAAYRPTKRKVILKRSEIDSFLSRKGSGRTSTNLSINVVEEVSRGNGQPKNRTLRGGHSPRKKQNGTGRQPGGKNDRK
jgi:hypothetical protein